MGALSGKTAENMTKTTREASQGDEGGESTTPRKFDNVIQDSEGDLAGETAESANKKCPV